MRAFEVHLNGKRLCLAGIGDQGVLDMMVDYVAGRGGDMVSLHVGGLLRASNEHVVWRHLRLRAGDEVTLKIVETVTVDKPRQKYRVDPKRDERQRKAYVRNMAKQFGWKLVMPPRKTK